MSKFPWEKAMTVPVDPAAGNLYFWGISRFTDSWVGAKYGFYPSKFIRLVKILTEALAGISIAKKGIVC